MKKVIQFIKIKKIFLPLHIFFICFCVMLCTVTTLATKDIVEKYETNNKANYKPVYATFVDYRKHSKNSKVYYNMVFEYVDDNGQVYSGEQADPKLISIKNADSMLGKKLLVFVDQELGLITHDLYFHKTEAIFIGLIAAVGYCVLAYSLFWSLIWLLNRIIYYKESLVDKAIVDNKVSEGKPKALRRIIISLVSAILFAVCTYYCIQGVKLKTELAQIQVPVKATISGLKEFDDSDGEKYYKIYFTYQSDDVEETNVYQSSIRSKSYAESKIGESVKVYLNTKTNKVYKNREFSSQADFFGICIAISFVVFMFNFMPWVLYIVQKKYYMTGNNE